MPRRDYSSYCWWDENNKFTKYNSISEYGVVDNRTELLPKDDAAYVMYDGKRYRIPTVKQFEELFKYTEIEESTESEYGNGFVFRSKINDEMIYIPRSGIIEGVNYREHRYFLLWTRECSNNSTNAFGIETDMSMRLHVFSYNKTAGLQIRPIRYE